VICRANAACRWYAETWHITLAYVSRSVAVVVRLPVFLQRENWKQPLGRNTAWILLVSEWVVVKVGTGSGLRGVAEGARAESFPVHVKLSYRIVSYRISLCPPVAVVEALPVTER